MFITLIRHGEVEARYQGRYIGHTDSHLSDFGIKDARQLADYLKQHHQHRNFDAFFCSDLTRCKQTLKPILKNLNLSISPLYTDKLREKSWGKHEAMNYEEICQLEKTSFQNFDQWLNIMDGETKEQFIQRIKLFKQKLSQSGYENVLIVTHGGVIRTFIYLFSNLTFEQSFFIPVPYASFIVLKL
ncbi:MAG: histidine phosphatase family protein [Pseudomonadota bacterium]